MGNFKNFMNNFKKVLQDNNFTELFVEESQSIEEEESITLKGKIVVDGEEIIAVVSYSKERTGLSFSPFSFTVKVHFDSFHYYSGSFLLTSKDEADFHKQLEDFEKYFLMSFEKVKAEHQKSKTTPLAQETTPPEVPYYILGRQAEEEIKYAEALEYAESVTESTEEISQEKLLSVLSDSTYLASETANKLALEKDTGESFEIDFDFQTFTVESPFGVVSSLKSEKEMYAFKKLIKSKLL